MQATVRRVSAAGPGRRGCWEGRDRTPQAARHALRDGGRLLRSFGLKRRRGPRRRVKVALHSLFQAPKMAGRAGTGLVESNWSRPRTRNDEVPSTRNDDLDEAVGNPAHEPASRVRAGRVRGGFQDTKTHCGLGLLVTIDYICHAGPRDRAVNTRLGRAGRAGRGLWARGHCVKSASIL